MILEEHFVPPSSDLINDYINGEEKLSRYFSYSPEQASFEKRHLMLRGHAVDRAKLSQVIRSNMEPYGVSPKAEENLKHFLEGASVVITGQQAGLLTGPLYTIHKAISTIVLAKEAQ